MALRARERDSSRARSIIGASPGSASRQFPRVSWVIPAAWHAALFVRPERMPSKRVSRASGVFFEGRAIGETKLRSVLLLLRISGESYFGLTDSLSVETSSAR